MKTTALYRVVKFSYLITKNAGEVDITNIGGLNGINTQIVNSNDGNDAGGQVGNTN